MHQRKGCARGEYNILLTVCKFQVNIKIIFIELIKEHIYDGMLCPPFQENDITSITGIKHHFYKQVKILIPFELFAR